MMLGLHPLPDPLLTGLEEGLLADNDSGLHLIAMDGLVVILVNAVDAVGVGGQGTEAGAEHYFMY